ncbi:hypothetical protein [Cupriavidus sp. YAF13]|uniref:hypothetical protein n=1 Tax=Cupriavidus sp. YAF13 TaxID=3233075 RepID=UPI003F929A4C
MAGRKPFEPTTADCKLVESAAAFGIPQDEIARLIINPQTGKPLAAVSLRKHFRTELETGATKANIAVANSLFRAATGSGKGAVTAAIWWTKSRMRWRGDGTDPEDDTPPAAQNFTFVVQDARRNVGEPDGSD